MVADPSIPAIDPTVALTLRSSLALLFLVASAHKLSNMAAFRTAVAGYEIVPPAVVSPFAALIVFAELVLAAALVIPPSAAPAALLAAALLSVYTTAIGVNLLRGRHHIDCGCAGPAGARPLSPGLVARNAILVGVALTAALPVTSRPLLWLDLVTVTAAAAVLNLLFAAGDAALASRGRRGNFMAFGLRRLSTGAGKSIS